MKFNVSSTKLFQQLQAATRIVPSSGNVLEILKTVLFELEGNTLTMTCSDGETTIRSEIEVESAEGSGKVAFQAKLMFDTLKEFPEQPLTFDIDNSAFGLNITSANGTYTFFGLNGNEYPVMPTIEEDCHDFNISSKLLLEAISKTIFCTSNDELRPVMNGINVDLRPDHITFVATDSHRLVRFNINTIFSEEPVNFILPKKPANLLRSVLAKDDTDVKVTFGKKSTRFEFGKTLIICRQTEGNYPNYIQLIDRVAENNYSAIIDRQTMLNACKRVAVFANNSSVLLKLAIAENQINISSQDIDFSTSAEETIACSYAGPAITIGFKGTLLIELLNFIESSEIELRIADPTRAGLILPVEQEPDVEMVMVQMPMMLTSD